MGNWASHVGCFLGVLLLTLALSSPTGLFTESNKRFKNAAQVLIWALLPPSCAGSRFGPEVAPRELPVCEQREMQRMTAPFSGLLTAQV